MSDNAKAQITPAPNSLRLKVGGRFGAIDADAIAKAEAALKSLSGQFAQWLDDEIKKLDAARAARPGPTATRPRPPRASICAPTT